MIGPVQTYHTLIIGGGIAGASMACSLAERGVGRGVGLVDPHLFGNLSSSERNGGGVRATFAEAINIRVALKSAAFYRRHADKFEYRQRGYVWLYTQPLWEQAQEFLPVVRSYGLPVEQMTPAQAIKAFPVLGDLDDVAGVTHTPTDGRLSPHKLRMHYLETAKAGGVAFLDGFQAAAIDAESSPVRVTLRSVRPDQAMRTLTDPALLRGAELMVTAERVVNAAGPWAARVAKLYGRSLPVTAVARQVYLLKHSSIDLESQPFFLDYAQDIYFRYLDRDGGRYTLVSWSDPDEPDHVDFTFKGPAYYEKHVKPRMVRRIPALADAELGPGWAGHYELTPDKTAILGPVPGLESVWNFNGLSAHGVMQSRGLGEALAERLITGAWPVDLDLSDLSEARFSGTDPLRETMYV
jgi:sarcosine oxidase subunit beta